MAPLRFWKFHPLFVYSMACTAMLASSSVGLAQNNKPDRPGGGGTTAAYSLVDLVSPFHAIDGNWSDTEAIGVSRRATATSPLYVIGSYHRDAQGNLRSPCFWSVSPAGSAVAFDLAASLSSANAVNSSGVVAGRGLNDLPAVRLPSGLVVTLPTPGGTEGGVTAITELAGTAGSRTFRAVGTHGRTSSEDASSSIWILSETGDLLDTIPLRDPLGTNLNANDINADFQLAGSISIDGQSVTAVAEVIADDLWIAPLELTYSTFVYLWDAHINDDGDVMAEAGEPVDPSLPGVYRRTFVWPATGGMLNLSDLNGGSPVAGMDMASVGGQLQIVGEAYSSKGWYGFLYRDGQLQNINQLVSASGWNLWGGRGISNDGHIVGEGRLTVRRNVQFHGFLMLKQ